MCLDWGYGPIQDWQTLPPEGELVIDCSTVTKPHGPHITNVAWTYDSTEGKTVLGYTLILVLWVVESQVYVLNVILPGSENRNELFREVLKSVKKTGLLPVRVLFDNGYAAQDTLNLIHRLGWTYVTRVKCNRKFRSAV